jgi:hypothetical protein
MPIPANEPPVCRSIQHAPALDSVIPALLSIIKRSRCRGTLTSADPDDVGVRNDLFCLALMIIEPFSSS